jgi:hypothetical protein
MSNFFNFFESLWKIFSEDHELVLVHDSFKGLSAGKSSNVIYPFFENLQNKGALFLVFDQAPASRKLAA